MTPADRSLTRRRAFRRLAGFLAASPLARAQQEIPYSPDRIPPLDDLVNLMEFEPVCRARILKANYDFIAGGVDNEWTLRRNRDAFDRITLRPRMLVDATRMDLATTLFGDKVGSPILIAPMAAHQIAHPEGEAATARGAEAQKNILILSSVASLPMETVAKASSFPKWWQLYARFDVEETHERVLRAADNGYKAICFTVDAPYDSHRERLLRNRVATQVPPGLAPGTRRVRPPEGQPPLPYPYRLHGQLVAHLDWSFVNKLNSWVKLPVLVKGILTAEDAELAIQHGAAGIVVSNHGGRYLEYAPSTIEVLPEIVQAVSGRVPVLVDSGFRRGTDVLKALAMGAKAVCIGRPALWGLGAYGEAGVRKVLELLETELALAMGLCGKANLAAVDKSLVRIDR